MGKNAAKNGRDHQGKRARGAAAHRPTRRTEPVREAANMLAAVKGLMREKGLCEGCASQCANCPNMIAAA